MIVLPTAMCLLLLLFDLWWRLSLSPFAVLVRCDFCHVWMSLVGSRGLCSHCKLNKATSMDACTARHGLAHVLVQAQMVENAAVELVD
jgi:hypothetical protein